jgi:hypothetical protein
MSPLQVIQTEMIAPRPAWWAARLQMGGRQRLHCPFWQGMR